MRARSLRKSSCHVGTQASEAVAEAPRLETDYYPLQEAYDRYAQISDGSEESEPTGDREETPASRSSS